MALTPRGSLKVKLVRVLYIFYISGELAKIRLRWPRWVRLGTALIVEDELLVRRAIAEELVRRRARR